MPELWRWLAYKQHRMEVWKEAKGQVFDWW